LRKGDLELWNAMVNEIREKFNDAVEQSGKDFTTDPFFMALLLAQQRAIKQLQAELKILGVEMPNSMGTTMTTLGV
jgi:hypothetical protein